MRATNRRPQHAQRPATQNGMETGTGQRAGTDHDRSAGNERSGLLGREQHSLRRTSEIRRAIEGDEASYVRDIELGAQRREHVLQCVRTV